MPPHDSTIRVDVGGHSVVVPDSQGVASYGLAKPQAAGRLGMYFVPLAAIWIWSMLIVGVCEKALLTPTNHSIYQPFAQAGRQWLAGGDLYWVDGPAGREWEGFRYSPLAALALAPFGALPDAVGGMLWRLANILVFLAGFHLLAFTLYPDLPRRRPFTWGLLFVMLIPLALPSFHNGQANLLVAGALLLALAAFHQERWTLAALGLSVAFYFKLYPLAFILLLGLYEPVKLGPRVLVCLALGFLLPFALRGPEQAWQDYRSWLSLLHGDDRTSWPMPETYRDFHVLVRWLGWSMPLAIYRLVQLAAAVLIATVCLSSKLRGFAKERQLRLVLDLGCVWMILFGPATESPTYSFLAPTFAFLLGVEFSGKPWFGPRGVVAFCSALLLFSAIAAWFPHGKEMVFMLQPLAVLILMVERVTAQFTPRAFDLLAQGHAPLRATLGRRGSEVG